MKFFILFKFDNANRKTAQDFHVLKQQEAFPYILQQICRMMKHTKKKGTKKGKTISKKRK